MNDSRTAVIRQLYDRRHFISVIIIQEVECGGVDCIELAQDRDRGAGTCECGNEPSGSVKCGEFLD